MPTLSAIASQLFRWFNFIALNIDDVFTALIEYMAHIGWRPPFSNLMLVLDDGNDHGDHGDDHNDVGDRWRSY